MVHVDAPEEHVMKEYIARTEIGTEVDIAGAKSLTTPLAIYLEAKVTSETSESFPNTPTTNSFQDSLESIDSIVDSDCNHSERETSESEEIVDTFFMEHIHFLNQSTQPQEVELVYDNN
jgi:hypothetical protein